MSGISHHDLNETRLALVTDLLKSTKNFPLFLDELGKKYFRQEAAMVELIKSLKDEHFTDIHLEHTVDGRWVAYCLSELA